MDVMHRHIADGPEGVTEQQLHPNSEQIKKKLIYCTEAQTDVLSIQDDLHSILVELLPRVCVVLWIYGTSSHVKDIDLLIYFILRFDHFCLTTSSVPF